MNGAGGVIVEQRSSDNRRCPGQRGFTLVEVLVAVVITSLVLMAVYGVFTSVSGAKQRLETDGEAYHRARVLFDRIGREVRSAYVRTSDTNTLFKGGINNDDYPYLTLTTTTTTPQSDAEGVAVVYYELTDDPEATNEDKVLMRNESSPLDENREQSAYRLAVGVESMTLRFFNGSDWQDEWDATTQGGLPTLVEVTLSLRSGDRTVPFRSSFDVPVVQEP